MKSIVAALAAIACSVVSAQNIISSRPSLNQVLVAGTSAQIVWAPVDGTIANIDLRQGDKNALTFLETIATNVPANTGSYTWNVPATLPAGTDYALSFGQSPNESYSPYFTIQAGNGEAPAPASSSSAPAPASSGPAAAASSAVASVGNKASSAAAGATSAAKSATSAAASATEDATSGANKNVAAVGAMALAGAVAAALI